MNSLKEAIKLYESGTSQAEAEKTRNQQAFKREKERLDSKIKDLSRLHEEALEREESLISELKLRQDAQRQLKLRLQELEDFQGNHQTRSGELKLNTLNEQVRDLTAERNLLRQQTDKTLFEREAIEGQLEETKDCLMVLQEQLHCTETIKNVLEGELEGYKTLCTRLSTERDALQAELQSRRSDGTVVPGSSRLEEVVDQLERSSLERQSLLRENKRFERELRDTLAALAERDQSLLQSHDTINRTELKVRKLQTALEDSEAQISDLERTKRRLNAELLEEKERAERFQRDFERMRMGQRQQFALLATVDNSSCSSITSKLTETTIIANE